MTEYQNTVTNPDAPWSSIPDSEENILRDLECYTLDPVFELYGNFVNPSPEWLSEDVSAKYAGYFRKLSLPLSRFPPCHR